MLLVLSSGWHLEGAGGDRASAFLDQNLPLAVRDAAWHELRHRP